MTDTTAVIPVMCGECGGREFHMRLVNTTDGGGTFSQPEKVVMTCVRADCPGAIEVKLTRPRLVLDFDEKFVLLMSDAEKRRVRLRGSAPPSA